MKLEELKVGNIVFINAMLGHYLECEVVGLPVIRTGDKQTMQVAIRLIKMHGYTSRRAEIGPFQFKVVVVDASVLVSEPKKA